MTMGGKKCHDTHAAARAGREGAATSDREPITITRHSARHTHAAAAMPMHGVHARGTYAHTRLARRPPVR